MRAFEKLVAGIVVLFFMYSLGWSGVWWHGVEATASAIYAAAAGEAEHATNADGSAGEFIVGGDLVVGGGGNLHVTAESFFTGEVNFSNTISLRGTNIFGVIPEPMRWSIDGNAYTNSRFIPVIAGFDGIIDAVYAYSYTAPTGSDIVLRITVNDVPIYTNTNTGLHITNGGNVSTLGTSFSNRIFSARDRVSFNVEQVGSTIAGGGPLLVTVVWRRTY